MFIPVKDKINFILDVSF